MQILTVVIGLIFILLLLSLLATTLMELISSFFRLRGRNLLTALHNMLASCDKDATMLKEFQQNSLYKHLTQQYGQRSQGPPSYMAAETFQSILFDIILKGEDFSQLKERIDALPDDDLRNVLNQLLRQSNNELALFRLEVQNWYNNVMDRASGWFKRFTQQILLFIGLGIAIVFNADTIQIFDTLNKDPEALQQVVQMAESYVNTRDQMTLGPPQEREFDVVLEDVKYLISQELESVRSPLGLGWEQVEIASLGWQDVLMKILGFILTALAVSLGAPFWFDLLRKLVNIRSSGEKP